MLRGGRLAAAVSLAALLLGLGPWAAPRHGHAQTPEATKIRVEITDGGFDGKPDFTLEVEQGQVVELTFVWAHQVYVQDRHIFVLKGYYLETDRIDYYNREATLKFVADKPGTFDLRCDLDCEIHDKLKNGHLKVSRSGSAPATVSAGAAPASAPGAPSSAVAATRVALSPSMWEVAGGPVSLTAALKDAQGAPVAKAEVRFYVQTEFAGTKGLMEIGVAKTDKEGVARIEYTPTVAGEQRITARFEGMGLYGESEQSIQIRALSSQAAYSVAPTGLESLRRWAPLGLALVVLGVWSTFAYVLYQVYRIGRVR